jgi:DNA repair protein RadC
MVKMKVRQQTCRLVREGVARLMPRKLSCASIAVECFDHLRDLPHEEMWIVGVNGALEPVASCMIARGGAHGAALTPSDILRPVLLMGVSAFFMAHNHPSGDQTPSPEDLSTTMAVRRAADVVGLNLLDHLVVSRNGWTSILRCLGLE